MVTQPLTALLHLSLKKKYLPSARSKLDLNIKAKQNPTPILTTAPGKLKKIESKCPELSGYVPHYSWGYN
jgi:hypothetical protein